MEPIDSIVDGAATITERRLPCYEPAGASALDAARLERWRTRAAAGNETYFQRRLDLERLTPEAAARLVQPVRRVLPRELPRWAQTIERVLAEADSGPRDRSEHARAGRTPLPFQHVVQPMVDTASRMLDQRIGPLAERLLSAEARSDLEAGLLRRLIELGASTLLHEFSLFRAAPRAGHWGGPFFGTPPGADDRYREFVEQLRGPGLAALFSEYCVLARLIGVVIDTWVDRTAELLQRLDADAAELAARFGGGAALGQVTRIEPDLSDSHDGGQAVAALHFGGGAEIIYKPRCLDMDQAFAELAAWVHTKGRQHELRALRVLSRASHGWVERARHQAAADAAAITRFYERAGMLLCIVYFVAGGDFHYENLIAEGEHPLPIDLETLCQHRVRYLVETHAGRELFEGVLFSKLLPRWERGAGGRSFDISGFAGDGGQESGLTLQSWRHINTDQMELGTKRGVLAARKNLPFLAGASVDPCAHLDEIIRGFRDTYRLFVEHRGALLAPGGPLDRFRGLEARVLLRATDHYCLLLRGAIDPRNLRAGIDWSLHFETLYRALVARPGAEIAHVLPLVQEERASMERLDVPRFCARTDSAAIPLPTGTADGYLAAPSMELITERLARAGEKDLEKQIACIRAAMFTRSASPAHRASPPAAEAQGAKPAGVRRDLGADLFAAARRIGDQIAERFDVSADGTVSLIAVAPMDDGHYQIQPLGCSLYSGLPGVALFLAQLGKLAGESRYTELAAAALRPVRAALDEPAGSALLDELGLGAGLGLGSLIYALTRVAALTGDQGLLVDAVRIAAHAGPRISADDKLDVLGGTAGLLLALLALHGAASGDGTVLALARACGDHLLSRRQAGSSGARAWPTSERRLLCGFSHGAAGIACALARLHHVAAIPAYLDAAAEAVEYEASERRRLGDWPDLRIGSGQRADASWCNGAAGIGLGRLAALHTLDGEQIRDDLDHALVRTLAAPPAAAEHLCCGTMGRIELLLCAGRTLGRADLIQHAHARAARFLDRMDSGDLAWSTLGGIYNPCLFQGTAGIGYELLRLCCPLEVPSLLAFS